MADALTEQETDNIILHNAGQCEVYCQYCLEDTEWENDDEV